jgi:Nucleotidyl transferase AbiEii toxin, Type IV TA system
VAEATAVTKLARTLHRVVTALPPESALVGGLAVSARAEPRFTRDVDFAIAVDSDAQAERVIYDLQRRGFLVAAAIEQTTTRRLATVRMREAGDGPFVDLLFASCGAEPEIVAFATPLDVLGVPIAVAAVGDLIAMKLVSRDPKKRPRDQQDLVELGAIADASDWARAAATIELIAQRGFSRGRDLRAGLAELRADVEA